MILFSQECGLPQNVSACLPQVLGETNKLLSGCSSFVEFFILVSVFCFCIIFVNFVCLKFVLLWIICVTPPLW